MNKHTPGPWKASFRETHPRIVIYSEEKRVGGCDRLYLPFGNLSLPEKEERANARLIAAAPELKKQLRYFVTVCPCGQHIAGIEIPQTKVCLRCDEAVKVLSKIEGES